MEYNKRELKILKEAYNDYVELKDNLNENFKNETNIKKVYDYMRENSPLNIGKKLISFCNVELDEDYFDFYYNSMCLTISKNNEEKICKLQNDIIIFDDEKGYELAEFDFNDLESLVLNDE